MDDSAAPVILAHTPDFAIGPLSVWPSTREVSAAGETREVIEPRVMQVLVALERAMGAVVSRDDLSQTCWEGRVVGDDAINRVISRLRRLAESSGAFRIETVTKVGFRLVRSEPVGSGPARQPKGNLAWPSRRTALTGLGVAALVGGLGGGAWLLRTSKQVPPGVAAMMSQADVALGQDSPEGNAQSIGLYRRIVEMEPDYADGWVGLAIAYAVASHQSPANVGSRMRARAADAARRATALDPGNLLADAALKLAMPYLGSWERQETALGAALSARPAKAILAVPLSGTLFDVGRVEDAVKAIAPALTPETQTPLAHYLHTLALWASNRLEEADQAASTMFELYPRHIGVWFIRVYLLLYSGRPQQALAIVSDRASRPPGIPDADFDIVGGSARAIASGSAKELDSALAAHAEAARRGVGYASNAMQFASAVGRVDDAFELAEALYLGRGFVPGSLFFSEQQATYIEPKDRLTRLLFLPTMAALRRDGRFAALVRELGLEAYWKSRGLRPDYQIHG